MHITPVLVGIVVGGKHVSNMPLCFSAWVLTKLATFKETLSFLRFDGALVRAVFQQRMVRVKPVARLTTRCAMAVGIMLLAFLTIPALASRSSALRTLCWTRALLLPLTCTAISTLVGYRAFVIHFHRPRLMTLRIHTLLAAEFTGCIAALVLSTKKGFEGVSNIVPGWMVVMLAIANVTAVMLARRLADPYLALRMQAVACGMWACGMFGAQCTFLSTQRERKASPSLETIRMEEQKCSASGTHVALHA